LNSNQSRHPLSLYNLQESFKGLKYKLILAQSDLDFNLLFIIKASLLFNKVKSQSTKTPLDSWSRGLKTYIYPYVLNHEIMMW
jgi:hypothetical protein